MLIHNTGIASPPRGEVMKTKNGLDVVYVTNFLGSFLMTQLLEESLSETARVVFTSSTGHYSGGSILGSRPVASSSQPRILDTPRRLLNRGTKFVQATIGITNSAPAYAHSKAQQVLFAHLLQHHFPSLSNNKRSAHAFTSTPIFSKFDVDWKTCISNHFFAILKATEKWIAVDTDEGAKTGWWLATCGGSGSLEVTGNE
ncbi:Nn.00g030030.m01.CDS01 [Neocucurbitaria sp. VM-36]